VSPRAGLDIVAKRKSYTGKYFNLNGTFRMLHKNSEMLEVTMDSICSLDRGNKK
jgi:hypothetical protein